MTVTINDYSDILVQRFETEKGRLQPLFPSDVTIEHVGSSAVRIGGKNIIDILIGVSNKKEMALARDILASNGYFEGNDTNENRIFMANEQGETGDGDYHIHICPINSDEYKNFIILRDYLKNNPSKAQEYLKMKHKFAREANYDRKKYKALKSIYVSRLLGEAKDSINQI